MNTTKRITIKWAAGLAWACAAIASAAPVDASLLTTQSGAYATCSPTTETVETTLSCALSGGEPEQFFASYRQTIRFIGTGCSAGGCSQDASFVYTDVTYGTGRKTATLERRCQGSTEKIYGLGACAC